MSGIAGWLDEKIDMSQKTTILNQMSEALAHRGPDDSGIFIEQNAALIHRRLSIVDPEGGKQPMRLKHKNHEYIIVYNGELYNARELKSELSALGWEFSTNSDTEVLLKAYAQWDCAVAQKLSGIYAFAVYESKAKKLYLCRDRGGVKPLFFYKYSEGIIFASEIKALLKSGKVEPKIDEQGLFELFFLGPGRTPGSGIFKGVSELLPGEHATCKNGIFIRQQYFKLQAKEHTDNEKQTIEKTRFLITDSIEKQLSSEVLMCFFLSGGLDSSIIVKVASDYFKKNGMGQIHTYNVDYEDNQKYFTQSIFQPNSDADFINLMSKDADSIHHTVLLNNDDLAQALYPALTTRDLPGMADIDASLLLFCQRVRQDFKVALSGEGADELFGGYPWYHNKEMLFNEAFPWSAKQDVRRLILKSGVLKNGEEYVKEKYFKTVGETDKLQTDSALGARMREMFSLNFYWFTQCLIDRKDRMSMYSGLEARVPFCDHRIVEYAYNMPWELKAFNGREKGIMRKAFEDILPKEIVYRKKSPYPKTHNPAYFNIVAQRVKEILQKNTQLTQLLSSEGVNRLIENPDELSSPWYGQLMRTPQILAYIIQLDYWIEQYGIELEV